MPDEEIQARLTLDKQQFSVGVGQLVAQLTTLETAVASLGGKLENNLDKNLGKIGTTLNGLSVDQLAGKLSSAGDKLGSVFGGIVQPAINFQAAMNNVNTVAKLSATDLAALSEQMRTLGRTTGIAIAPTEAAAAQYEILSSGFTNAADATKILTQAAIASKGGLTTTKDAADVLTSALNSYGAGADQAKHFNDVLFESVAQGKITFSDFVSGLGQVAPAAAANGVKIEELSASLAALTSAGIRPAVAFTGLNAAIVQLSSPTDQAKEAALGLGINLDSAGFKGLSLVQKLQLLAKTAGDNKSALRQILGDINALGVAYSLAGNGAKFYGTALTAMQGPLDSANQAFKTNSQGVQSAQERFKVAGEALKISLSEAILPALADLAEFGTSILQFFDKLPGPVKSSALQITAMAAALGVAAKVCGTFLFVSNGLAQALGTRIPVAAVAASTAMDGTAVAATGASTAMGRFGASLGRLGLIGVIGSVLIGLANNYVEVSKAADKAADDVVNAAGKMTKAGKVSTGAIIDTPVAALQAQGVGAEDVRNRIRPLRAATRENDEKRRGVEAEIASETERLSTQPALAAVIEKRLKELQKTREELLASSAELETKIAGLVAVEQKIGEAAKPKAKPEKDPTAGLVGAPPPDKKAIEERQKQALFEIETAKISGAERIKLLEAFIQKERLVGEEKRSILRKIAEEQSRIDSAAESAQKKLVDDQKADALQAIDLSNASHQQKIQQLGELAKKYKDDADLRRRILGEIAREEDAIAKDSEDKRKKREDDAKKAQEDALNATSEQRSAQGEALGLKQDAVATGISKSQEKIDAARDKGGPGAQSVIRSETTNIQALLQQRQALTEESIRLQLAEQLATTKSADAKAQLERNAEEKIRQERQKTADEQKKLTDAQIAEINRLEDAKKPAQKKFSTEFTGAVLTPAELAKQQEERFGAGAGTEDFQARQLASKAEEFAKRERGIQLNLAEAQRKGIDVSKALNPQALAGLQPIPQKTLQNLNPPPQAQTLKLEHVIDIRLTREDGSTQTQRVTVAGVPGPAQGANSVNFGTRGRA